MEVTAIVEDPYLWSVAGIVAGQFGTFLYLRKEGGRHGLSRWLERLSGAPASRSRLVSSLQALSSPTISGSPSRPAAERFVDGMVAHTVAKLDSDRKIKRLNTAHLAGIAVLVLCSLGVALCLWSRLAPEAERSAWLAQRALVCQAGFLALAVELLAGAELIYLYLDRPPARQDGSELASGEGEHGRADDSASPDRGQGRRTGSGREP